MGVRVSQVGERLPNGMKGVAHHWTVYLSMAERKCAGAVLMGKDL
jgi:hypothetical protein